MNVQEGSRRIKGAGFWLSILPVVLYISYGIVANHGIGLVDLALLPVPGILLMVIGWIVQGFAQNIQ